MDLSLIKTAAITLLAAGIIFAFGLVILNKLYTTATYEDITVVDSFTVPAKYANVTLDHGDIQTFSFIKNATAATFDASNYTVTNSNGNLQFLDNSTTCKTAMMCNATYVYREYNTTAGLAVAATEDALGELPNNWFTIIAVVIAGITVLAIVLKGLGQAGNR